MGIVNQSACGAGLTKAGHLVPDNISATLAFTADLRSSHNRKSVRKNHSAYIAFMTVFRPIGQPVMRAHPAADGADAVRKRVKRLYLTANGTFPAECIFRFQDLCMLQLRITCSAPMVVHRNSIAVLVRAFPDGPADGADTRIRRFVDMGEMLFMTFFTNTASIIRPAVLVRPGQQRNLVWFHICLTEERGFRNLQHRSPCC